MKDQILSAISSPSTTEAFHGLPTELKLSVLDSCNASALESMSKSNNEFRNLSICALSKRIRSIFNENKFFISFFCPERDDKNVELYATHSLVNSNTLKSGYSTFDQLQLKSRRKLLGSEIFNVPIEPSKSDKNGISLIVDDGMKNIPLHMGLVASSNKGMSRLFRFDDEIKLSHCKNQSGTMNFCNGFFRVHYKLENKGKIPMRSPYDFDLAYRYDLTFTNFQIGNWLLLHRFEDQITTN